MNVYNKLAVYIQIDASSLSILSRERRLTLLEEKNSRKICPRTISSVDFTFMSGIYVEEEQEQMEKEQKGMEDLVENKERLRSLYICP